MCYKNTNMNELLQFTTRCSGYVINMNPVLRIATSCTISGLMTLLISNINLFYTINEKLANTFLWLGHLFGHQIPPRTPVTKGKYRCNEFFSTKIRNVQIWLCVILHSLRRPDHLEETLTDIKRTCKTHTEA